MPEAPPPRSLANFCAQAADLVRVRSLSCTRNGRSRHFRQKNTYVLAQFPSDPLPGLLWPRCLPDASQMSPRCLPEASQMPFRCFSDASRCLQIPPDASQMPLRCPRKDCLGTLGGQSRVKAAPAPLIFVELKGMFPNRFASSGQGTNDTYHA